VIRHLHLKENPSADKEGGRDKMEEIASPSQLRKNKNAKFPRRKRKQSLKVKLSTQRGRTSSPKKKTKKSSRKGEYSKEQIPTSPKPNETEKS